MPKAKTRTLTRQQSDAKYNKGSSELSKTEPSTYRQLIRYYYHLKNTDSQSSISRYCKQTKKDLMVIWQSVNPRLRLISTKLIEKIIGDLLAVGKRYQPKAQ